MKGQHSIKEKNSGIFFSGTFLIIISCFIVLFSLSVNAQDDKEKLISISCKNRPISYVFRKIEDYSGCIIFYNEKHINVK